MNSVVPENVRYLPDGKPVIFVVPCGNTLRRVWQDDRGRLHTDHGTWERAEMTAQIKGHGCPCLTVLSEWKARRSYTSWLGLAVQADLRLRGEREKERKATDRLLVDIRTRCQARLLKAATETWAACTAYRTEPAFQVGPLEIDVEYYEPARRRRSGRTGEARRRVEGVALALPYRWHTFRRAFTMHTDCGHFIADVTGFTSATEIRAVLVRQSRGATLRFQDATLDIAGAVPKVVQWHG